MSAITLGRSHDGVDQVVRARAGKQRVNALRSLARVCRVQCALNCAQVRPRALPEHTSATVHMPGAATFKNARHGVVDLHAGAHVINAQRDHVGQGLGWPWTAVGYFVGGHHMVGDVAVGGGQFDHFGHHLRGSPSRSRS
jgi:hypothetical protein